MRDLRELFNTTGGWRRFLILLLLRCPFDILSTLLHAIFLQSAFDAISCGNMEDMYRACVLFTIGTFLLFLYNGTVWTLFATFVVGWTGAIRRNLFEHISKISLAQMESRAFGEWFTRLNSDVQSAAAMLNQPIHLPHAAVAIVNLCVSAVILVAMKPAVFALATLFLVPHLLINQFCVTRHLMKLSMDAQEAAAENATDLNTIVSCADTAILYDAREFLLEHFDISSRRLLEMNMKIRLKRSIESGLTPLMSLSGYLIILFSGYYWISRGTMTFGELTAALQYRGGILAGAMMFLSCLMNMKAALAGIKRVNETIKIPSEE